MFEGDLELSDAAVVVLLLCGGESVASTSAAADVVALSSSQGKGRFKLYKEFFDLVVLVGAGFGEMDDSPLDNIFAVPGSGGRVVKVSVEVIG